MNTNSEYAVKQRYMVVWESNKGDAIFWVPPKDDWEKNWDPGSLFGNWSQENIWGSRESDLGKGKI